MNTPAPLAEKKPANSKSKMNAYPWYSPRFWHGLLTTDWLKLVVKHRFRIHPFKWPMAAIISGFAPGNSVAALVQELIYGRYIRNTRIETPPVFIVGHWRSGTTLLHELLHLDSRFATPTTYQCMAAHHTLVTDWWLTPYVGWVIPKQRPMDNMAAGWHRPQEDEFALLSLGAPTPYQRMAFPNDRPDCSALLNLDETLTKS